MLLQVANAIPHIEGCIQTSEVVIGRVVIFRLGASSATPATSMVARWQTVEEREVLGQESWQLRLARKGAAKVLHNAKRMVCVKMIATKLRIPPKGPQGERERRELVGSESRVDCDDRVRQKNYWKYISTGGYRMLSKVY